MSALTDQAERLRADTRLRVPGRLDELIEARVAQLLGAPGAGAGLPDDLTPAETVAIEVAEQFVVDVHGITDERFARLGEHFSPAEQVAIVFHLALTDGFTKLRVVEA